MILRPILNEDFIDSLNDDEMVSSLPDMESDDDSLFNVGIFFTVSAINKNVKPEQYTTNIKRLFSLLNRAFELSVKIPAFKRFDERTPVYVYWKPNMCDESRTIDGLDMHWKSHGSGVTYEDIDSLINRNQEYCFSGQFKFNENSISSMAQELERIITIFCSCVRKVYGSGINPRNIDIYRFNSREYLNPNSQMQLKEPYAHYLDQGDLRALGDLWKFIHKLNPMKFDISGSQKASSDYLMTRHSKVGYTPFIHELIANITVPQHELKIIDDKENRVVVFNIPKSKKFALKNGDELMKLTKNNNYTLKINGGNTIKFYGSDIALEWIAEAIHDSGIQKFLYAPENIDPKRLKNACGANAKPIDVVGVVKIFCKLDAKPEEKQDGGTMWNVQYIKPKYIMSDGIVELPINIYTNKFDSQ